MDNESREYILDKLRRANEMEEEMQNVLIEICQAESLPRDIPEEIRERMKAILNGIKEDTMLHKKFVMQTMESLR